MGLSLNKTPYLLLVLLCPLLSHSSFLECFFNQTKELSTVSEKAESIYQLLSNTDGIYEIRFKNKILKAESRTKALSILTKEGLNEVESIELIESNGFQIETIIHSQAKSKISHLESKFISEVEIKPSIDKSVEFNADELISRFEFIKSLETSSHLVFSNLKTNSKLFQDWALLASSLLEQRGIRHTIKVKKNLKLQNTSYEIHISKRGQSKEHQVYEKLFQELQTDVTISPSLPLYHGAAGYYSENNITLSTLASMIDAPLTPSTFIHEIRHAKTNQLARQGKNMERTVQFSAIKDEDVNYKMFGNSDPNQGYSRYFRVDEIHAHRGDIFILLNRLKVLFKAKELTTYETALAKDYISQLQHKLSRLRHFGVSIKEFIKLMHLYDDTGLRSVAQPRGREARIHRHLMHNSRSYFFTRNEELSIFSSNWENNSVTYQIISPSQAQGGHGTEVKFFLQKDWKKKYPATEFAVRDQLRAIDELSTSALLTYERLGTTINELAASFPSELSDRRMWINKLNTTLKDDKLPE